MSCRVPAAAGEHRCAFRQLLCQQRQGMSAIYFCVATGTVCIIGLCAASYGLSPVGEQTAPMCHQFVCRQLQVSSLCADGCNVFGLCAEATMCHYFVCRQLQWVSLCTDCCDTSSVCVQIAALYDYFICKQLLYVIRLCAYSYAVTSVCVQRATMGHQFVQIATDHQSVCRQL